MIRSLTLRVKKYLQSDMALLLLASAVSFSASTAHAEPAQEPLFLTTAATPVVMFAMSRDHELFKKAYNDYTNMDGGVMSMRDTTYNNDFSYYGYFDSGWCYTYANKKFSPSNSTSNHQCSGEWSGNFLNWATMTRIDILRQVLYGGKRQTDTASSTVLERSYLPKDNHAFAKVYDPRTKDNTSGPVSHYVPAAFAHDSITLCNVSSGNGGEPEIRVAKGQWYNWANTEVQQCQWDVEATNPNYDSSNRSELGTLVARVEVCVTDKDANASRCKTYDSGAVKPIGVLQEYEGTVKFGLVTGTWGKNRSGGVLRKKAMPLVGNAYTGNTDNVNEYDTNTGIFNGNVTGIIGNIDRFEIVGYKFSDNSYSGDHSDWGNPLGEIYAETLRYLSGSRPATDGLSSAGPTWNFSDGDSGGGPAGITNVATWDDPLADAEECTRCSVIVISSGPNSWDSDDVTSAMIGSIVSGVTLDTLNTDYTNKIGTLEFGNDPSFFNGGTDRATQCSSGNMSLSEVRGLCPEEPMAQGSYVVAGLAYMAKTNSIRTGETNRTVDTFAIELSQGLPSLDIPVGSGTMSIVPICTSQDHGQTCSLVSVRVEDIQSDNNGNPVRGSYLFYWEDQDQGSDHDMDSVQRIEFCIGKSCQDFGTGTGEDADSTHRGSDKTYRMHDQKITHNAVPDNHLRIINSIPYWATGAQMGLTYIISGTSTDGLQATEWVKRGGNDAHNLVNSSGEKVVSSLGDWNWYNTMPPEGSDYLPPDDGDARIYLKTKTFAPGSSTTNRLRSPLFYAAKYGNFESLGAGGAPIGWDKINNNTNVDVPDGIPDAYFSVNNPALLEERIKYMIGEAAKVNASATAVATNSTRLTEGSKIYQAMFNSEHWYGRLSIREMDDKNNLAKASVTTESAEADAVTTFPEPANRKIFTRTRATDGGAWTRTEFLWANLNATQRNLLNSGSELGEARVNWLRGASTNEGTSLRSRDFQVEGKTRRHIMGDVVNSSPVISGRKNARYQRIPGEAGTDYKNYSAPNLLFVGANDGKLHAFNPETLEEIFAYVPNAIYHKLAAVTHPEYGQGNRGHQYLVDGPLYVGDVYKNGNWRTILVGTFGAGTRGFYALDVTGGTEPTVLFELTEEDHPQLGYMLGQPQIVPLVNGGWAIVAGNGYHYEDSTNSQLVVVNLANNAVSFIDTGSGRGLSEPALLPNFSGLVQYAYAGDREGNLWKFDITGNNSMKLFEARDDSNTAQPITSMPTLGLNPLKNDAVMIYFGTGKYFDIGDNVPAASPVQSFYALVDSGTLIGYDAGRRDGVLHKKSITQSGEKRTINGERVTEEGIESSAVDWTDIRGWYLDFDQGDKDTSERVITKPQLLFDRLIFTTLIPSDDPCVVGGQSWLMELVAIGNKNIAHRILHESVINSMRGDAVVNDSGVGMGADNVWVIPCDVTGECDLLDGKLPGGARGRMSWKQMD